MSTFKSLISNKVYIGHLNEYEVNFMQMVGAQSKYNGKLIPEKLAGNIQHQVEAVFDEKTKQVEEFFKIINPHVQAAVKEFDSGFDRIFKDKEKEGFLYDLGEGPWVNFQKAGEFNPVHSHSGIVSAVIYIDVPECIAEEHSGALKSAGNIDFIFGEASYWSNSILHHVPRTGEILIFPAHIKHTVYPFKSNVERVSMSFNVQDIS